MDILRSEESDDEGDGGDDDGQSVAEDVEREVSMIARVEDNDESTIE